MSPTLPDGKYGFLPREVAEILDVPLRTVQRWLTTGRIKGERRGKLGHTWRVQRAELERLIEQK